MCPTRADLPRGCSFISEPGLGPESHNRSPQPPPTSPTPAPSNNPIPPRSTHPTPAMAPCVLCPPASPRRALLRRPKTLQPVCKECFFAVFEQEIHHAIIGYGQAEQVLGEDGTLKGKPLFRRGERVAIGASGGKGKSGAGVGR